MAIAGSTLLAAGPILGAAGAAVAVTLGRPILFRQSRIGRGDRTFEVLKFRTMRDGPEPDAERLTPLGRWLRATSLDELPQLVNVLRGEMSIVGPRPLLPRYLARYTPEQRRRHDVLPGLTGWTQVNGRNALSWTEKFEHDLWYVDHWSLALDARILAKTLLHVARGEGISADGHATMPEFEGSE